MGEEPPDQGHPHRHLLLATRAYRMAQTASQEDRSRTEDDMSQPRISVPRQRFHQARTAHADPMIRPFYYLPHGFVWRDPDERMDWELTHHMEV